MADDQIYVHVYRGPSSEKCECRCNEDGTGSCEHLWNGPEFDMEKLGMYGTSATCSRCGMLAFTHDIRQ